MARAAAALPVIFCFAGQGSQYYQMAAELMRDNTVFRHWMGVGDAIVAHRHGFSVLAEIYGDDRRPGHVFERLQASHPAIFMVQYALAKVFQHQNVRPDMLLGVSLGEFTAQAVAGMTGFETALTAIADQPALFARTCPPGTMIAVLGSPELHARSAVLTAASEIAGINSAGHFILSALADDLPRIEAELKAAEVPFQRLPVPFAFHSRFIDAAEAQCRAAAAGERRETPFWPVWSCCTGTPIDADSVDLSWRIVRDSMNVRPVIATLEAQGGAVYVDLSPSGTLAALFRQSLDPNSPSKLLSVLSPFGGDSKRLAATLAALGA